MNSKAMKLTYGAMLVALFGVMLLFNRQSGGMLEGLFLYILPIPMVAYAAMYGARASVPVLVCMIFVSFLMGTFTSIFYAMSEVVIGLALGLCLNRRVEQARSLLLTMVLSAAANLISTVALASLFGYDIEADIAAMQDGMARAAQMTGMALPPLMTSHHFLKRLFVISMAFAGVIQGLVIFVLSLSILRRLHFPVERPKRLTDFKPPVWSGYAALAAFMGYCVTMAHPMEGVLWWNVAEMVGLAGYLYLLCFGYLAVLLYLQKKLPRARLLRVLLAVLAFIMLPQLLLIMGYLYISTSMRDKLMGSA